MAKDEKSLIRLNTIKGYEDIRDCHFFNTETLEFLGGRWELSVRALRPNNAGYLRLTVRTKDGASKTVYQHRTVALVLVEGFEEGLVVNHIDKNRLNNSPENLEWVSQKENLEHSKEEFLKACAKRRRRVKGINLMTGETIELNGCVEGEEYGFNPNLISAAARGLQKTHKGYKWEYLS